MQIYQNHDIAVEWLTSHIIPNKGPALMQLDKLGPEPELSTPECTRTHNNTLQVSQKTAWDSEPPKVGPVPCITHYIAKKTKSYVHNILCIHSSCVDPFSGILRS